MAPTVGVEQEFLTGHKVRLRRESARGRLADVTLDGVILAEIGTDVGRSLEYTLEMKTTPVEIDDVDGLAARKQALRALHGAVIRAAERSGPLVSTTIGSLVLTVRMNEHSVVATSERDAEGGVTFPSQVSIGLPVDALLENDTPEARLIRAHADWYDPGQAAIYRPSVFVVHPFRARAAYALVASAMNFYVKLSRAARAEGKSITDSKFKDQWKALPRGSIWAWVDALEADARDVKDQLRLRYGEPRGTREEVAAFQFLTSGSIVAGHPVPASFIRGRPADVFEFRSPPEELRAYLYQPEIDGRPAPLSEADAAVESHGLAGPDDDGPSNAVLEQARQREQELSSDHDDDEEWK